MGYVKADRPAASIIAAVVGAALMGSVFLSLAATNVAQAQTEPTTAANGVLLPPPNYDPAAARNEDVTASAAVPATPTPAAPPAEESAATDAPDANADAPGAVADTPADGSSVTTSLGGSDVAVSSVGGSHEVDRPKKRSERKR